MYNGTTPLAAAQRSLSPTRAATMGGRPRPDFPGQSFVNVLDSGAVGDGVTDDTAAFIKALAASQYGA